jgi:glycosyltransferase involved in cell wall biosynthesis
MLSVVAPVFNEEKVLAEFHRRVSAALEGVDYELVLVDDGSTDSSPQILRELAAADRRVRVIELSRNFGHQAALSAGLDRARGDAVVSLDADLQDPPEVIPEMVARWREGAEVVYAVRRSREGEGRFKLASARGFYRLFSRLARMDEDATSGDFRLLDRRAVEVLKAMPERSRFLRGMTVWVGFTQTAVDYDRDPRHAGETKFTLRRMLRFSMDAITSFSNVPLQLATLLGFAFSLVAFLGIPVAIGFRIAGEFVPGVASILLAVLLLGGIQLITLGIVGEYIGRIYEEVKGRPLYVVRGEITGDGEEPAPRT